MTILSPESVVPPDASLTSGISIQSSVERYIENIPDNKENNDDKENNTQKEELFDNINLLLDEGLLYNAIETPKKTDLKNAVEIDNISMPIPTESIVSYSENLSVLEQFMISGLATEKQKMFALKVQDLLQNSFDVYTHSAIGLQKNPLQTTEMLVKNAGGIISKKSFASKAAAVKTMADKYFDENSKKEYFIDKLVVGLVQQNSKQIEASIDQEKVALQVYNCTMRHIYDMKKDSPINSIDQLVESLAYAQYNAMYAKNHGQLHISKLVGQYLDHDKNDVFYKTSGLTAAVLSLLGVGIKKYVTDDPPSNNFTIEHSTVDGCFSKCVQHAKTAYTFGKKIYDQHQNNPCLQFVADQFISSDNPCLQFAKQATKLVGGVPLDPAWNLLDFQEGNNGMMIAHSDIFG